MKKKINVVIDTGVIVSAFWSSDGNPARIVKLFPDEITPCINDLILSEYREVLNRPKFDFSKEKKDAFLQKTNEYGLHHMPKESIILLPDEDDRIFYDTAKETGSILITGNIKHFPHEAFIMTPAQFLRMFDSGLL
jgi:putative PIN family toxin of toxin-antitoxin system